MHQQVQLEWPIHTEQQTVELAQLLASLATPGTVLALDGDLGAGKTRFSQAFAIGLGITEVVNSPTFTIIKEYQGTTMPLYHMDVYRLSLEEADELGLDDYFFGDGVTIVEWASMITELLPQERLELYIEHLGEEQRLIRITGYGERYVPWLKRLKDEGATEA